MRPTTALAVLLGTCAVAVVGVAGYTVAAGSDQVRSAARAATGPAAPAVTDTGQPMPSAPVVTVPDLAEESTGMPSTDKPIPGRSPASAERSPAPSPAPAKRAKTAEAHPAAHPAPGRTPARPSRVNPPYDTVVGWHGANKTAYLTFDDGPGPATPPILEVLAAAGVKATFCEVGQKVTENPGLSKRVVAEGHTLCNHSWDHHSPFATLSRAGIDAEIVKTQQALQAATGTTPRYFRAPEGGFGAPGGTVLLACQRFRTIALGWGVDSLDWTKPGTTAIVSTVLNTVTPGAVILMHDGGGSDRDQTVAALPRIITGLRAAGYTFAALPADPAG